MGSVTGHNVYKGDVSCPPADTLKECQQRCDENSKCRSIDFSKDGKCCLNDCRKGDAHCPIDTEQGWRMYVCTVGKDEDRCDWGNEITGSVDNHNLKYGTGDVSCPMAFSSTTCQLRCDANKDCRSIDWNPTTKYCCINDCQFGDPGCPENDLQDKGWKYFQCNEKKSPSVSKVATSVNDIPTWIDHRTLAFGGVFVSVAFLFFLRARKQVQEQSVYSPLMNSTEEEI